MVQAMAAVSEGAKGTIDVTTAGTRIGLFNAMARGGKIRFVADKGTFAKEKGVSGGFVVGKNFLDGAGRPDWSRIKGKKVSVDGTSFWGFLFDRYLAKNGLRADDLQMEDLPVTAIEAAFAQGSLAMAHLTEPWVSKVTSGGNAVLAVSDASLAPSAHFAAICFGPSLLEKDRAAGIRFMVAYLQGVRQYNRGKTARNIAILARNTGLDEATVRASAWPAIRNDGMIDPGGFVEFERWAKGKGLLDEVMLGNRLWDPSFVKEANRILGPEKP
jgi:NitT/TauT family transport system substrate-binding protein